MTPNLRKPSAFTMIELLVVVAIISVLVAMLMPVIQRVRAQARAVQCMGNLHALGNAASAYAADNHATLIQRAQLVSSNLYPWYQFLRGAAPSGRGRVYLPGTIGGHDSNAYRCPEMDPADRWPGSAWIVSTYGLVTPENGYDPAAVTTSLGSGNSMDGIRLTSIKSPSKYGLFFDTSAMIDYRYREGASDWSPTSLISPGGGAWAGQAKGIWLAHNGYANGAFADFHVEACSATEFRNASNIWHVYGSPTATGIRVWKDGRGNIQGP